MMLYFDSGATSLYRPKCVYSAVQSAMHCGNPGRGGHKAALEGARMLYRSREKLAHFFSSEFPEGVCFFYNATTALNCIVKTLVPPFGRLLISNMEHNALRRPALALEKRGVTVDLFNGYGTKEEILASFSEKIKKKPDLAAFLHTSNVCGQTLPVKELCALARSAGITTVIDCAQAAGHETVDIGKIGADGLVIPSHKGLMGIPGAGILICSEKMKKLLENAGTLMEGGSGISSFDEGMPQELPERLEWGTQALPAISSAAAGAEYLSKVGTEEVKYRLRRLSKRCAEGIGSITGLRLEGTKYTFDGTGPLLFTVRNGREGILANELYDRSVCVREGYHCAPLAHKSIGTERTGGIRVSFSVFNTEREVDALLKNISACAAFLLP